MRLHILVEGRTEQTFVRRVRGPHLCRVGWQEASATQLVTKRQGSRQWKGGVSRYARVKEDVVGRLRQHGDDVCVTTMIDLYSLPADFPAFAAHQANAEPYRRVAALEAAFAADIADRRFLPYLQLHEFEALLLTDLCPLADVFDLGAGALAPLQAAVRANGDNPELVDDGPTTSPSKRIIAAVPQYAGDKASVGPLVAEAIGLEGLRQRCRHFGEWLTKLEQMVQPAPAN